MDTLLYYHRTYFLIIILYFFQHSEDYSESEKRSIFVAIKYITLVAILISIDKAKERQQEIIKSLPAEAKREVPLVDKPLKNSLICAFIILMLQ